MAVAISIPRIVIGGVASGVGKTTVTVALARAFARRGLAVRAFKCGPDYLDPGYHRRVTGFPSHNLDGWMMGREAVIRTFASEAAGAALAIVEGVMGLFDGASPKEEAGSTAEIAKWLGAPVVLVADASGMARSLAALAQGFARFDPELRVAGVVANRVGSPSHLALLRDASREVPVLGGLVRNDQIAFPERHLGLVTASPGASPEAHFDAWADLARESLDLDRILELANSAPPLELDQSRFPPVGTARSCQIGLARIGLAWDGAFHFYYPENLARLEALGASLVRWSPIEDAGPPEVDLLYFGGGYPEAFARELSANRAALEGVRAFAARGGPVYAECGGLMYLSEGIVDLGGQFHPMAGLIPGRARMKERLAALGYVEVETQAPSILGPAGLRFRGHQFRYSELEGGDRGVETVYTLRKRRGGAVEREGYLAGSVLATYVHAHWASNPLVAEGLVDSATRFRSGRGS